MVVLATVLPNPPRAQASARDLDYLGIAVFSAGVVPLLLGLTNKGLTDSTGQLYAWTDPRVGGLIALAAVLLAIFVFVESRAREPIVPLDLFRGRDYSTSMAAVFLFGIAMFTAVIFMPRFYQTVRGISATESGYLIWPLLVGLIGGSLISGQVISRTGRYKWLMAGSTVLLMIGSFLMTRLTLAVGDWELWGWMLLLGAGLGPSLAGFTVVVQNAVPLTRLGVATSTLTFFRQIGGSVGLAIADTVFASTFASQLPVRLTAHGIPQQLIDQLVKQSNALQGVGNLTTLLRGVLPAQAQPLIPGIVAAVQEAFTSAVANLFWIPLVAGAMALVCTLILRDVPLRSAADLRQETLAEGVQDGAPTARPAPAGGLE
jgi:hypothetical protein